MKRFCYELIFIARIYPNGKGMASITEQENEELQKGGLDDSYKLSCLSVTEGTYIASGFSTYIIKLKGREEVE